MKLKLWGARFFLLLLGLIIGFSICEIVVRVAGIKGTPPPKLPLKVNERYYFDAFPTNPRNYFDVDLRTTRGGLYFKRLVASGVSRDALKKSPYAILIKRNSEHDRTPEFSVTKPAHTLRIILIGDSFTEGAGVREEDTFASRLTRIFKEKNPEEHIEIINDGHRGQDIWQIYDRFKRKASQWQPDIVLYTYNLNDAHLIPEMQARQNDIINDLSVVRVEKTPKKSLKNKVTKKLKRYFHIELAETSPFLKFLNQWDRLIARSRFLDVIRYRMNRLHASQVSTRWYQDMPTERNEPAWSKTKELILEMNQISKERGILFVVAICPLMSGLEKNYPFLEYHRAMKELLDRNGIPSIDLYPFFKGVKTEQMLVHELDAHPNEKGHEIMTRALHPFLLEQIHRVQEKTSSLPSR